MYVSMAYNVVCVYELSYLTRHEDMCLGEQKDDSTICFSDWLPMLQLKD